MEQLTTSVLIVIDKKSTGREELDYDMNLMNDLAKTMKGLYTAQDLSLHNILNGKMITGLSFLSDRVLTAGRARKPYGCLVLAMVTTGIAAMILTLVHTYHSRMRALKSLTAKGVFAFTSQSDLGGLISRAKILIMTMWLYWPGPNLRYLKGRK